MATSGSRTRTLVVEAVVDFLSAPEVQRSGVDLLHEPEFDRLVIDLSRVTFIDSSGLSVLVYLKGRCDERGLEMRLRGVPPRAHSLINSLGLGTYFEMSHQAT